ncbi:C40 family peptidase [bacterium]|nr:C40 family peptidase [bacterium]MBU1884034.1 C40 family peptidase [bacterium]
MIKLFIVIGSLLLLLSGCSSTPSYPQTDKRALTSNVSQDPIINELHAQYKKWHHAPYKYGGVCLEGVDCSGLIQAIYKDAFGIDIPRTTKEQLYIGKKIKYSHIKPGDLIFFRTGYNVRHVGIYFGQNSFLHASKKYGVIISSINNPYWREKYLMSRKVLGTSWAYTAKY